MKILYGVQGTGNGHISRARIMAQCLLEKNIDVDFLFSGRDESQYFDMEVFAECRYQRGFTLATNAGKVNYFATACRNSLLRFIQEVKSLNVEEYDFIISDFEPITAWAGKLRKKLVIGIGHQYAFDFNIPIAGDSFLSRSIMKHFAPADISLGLHWDAFNSEILPPIIDHRLCKNINNDDKHQPVILVYLPFEDQQHVSSLLQEISDYRFVQYAPSLENQDKGHVLLRKTCLEGFKHDLKSASGVICNTGFELISECLHMGTPVLSKPLDKQMEQLSNAAALDSLGYASTITHLSTAEISQWLAHNRVSKTYRFPDVASAIVDWLWSREADSINVLSSSLWQQCEYNEASR